MDGTLFYTVATVSKGEYLKISNLLVRESLKIYQPQNLIAFGRHYLEEELRKLSCGWDFFVPYSKLGRHNHILPPYSIAETLYFTMLLWRLVRLKK